MSEVSSIDTEPTRPDLLTGEELVTLNNYLGNHEAQLAVAGIFAIKPDLIMPKLRIMKELLIRQVPTAGNPTAADHKIRVEEAGGWVPHEGVPANWCIWSLEPAGLLHRENYQGRKGIQPAWQATELAVRALPYIGGLGEWSLNYADVSLQQATGGTPSISENEVRAPRIRHAIFRKLTSDSEEKPSTHEDLELAAAAEGLETTHIKQTIIELTDQGLLEKNPPNFDGRLTITIVDKYKKPIHDLVQTLEDVATEDGAELYSARAREILEDPELFLTLIAKAKRFSASHAAQIETHAGLQQRITEAVKVLGRAEVSAIHQHLQATGRPVNRGTIHQTIRELVDNETVEALKGHSMDDISKTATSYALKQQPSKSSLQ